MNSRVHDSFWWDRRTVRPATLHRKKLAPAASILMQTLVTLLDAAQ